MPAPSMSCSGAQVPSGTECRATVFEIERFALNDGPGIRTVVFFKGCPLRCLWCSNPESQRAQPELFYQPRRCLGCQACVEACPRGALAHRGRVAIDRERCDACGRCTQACNTGALSMAGRELSVQEIFLEVRRDEAFYRNSGGGVTFSGGEPAAQPRALRELAELCHAAGLHTCIETCGDFPWEAVRETLPALDLFLFDIKLVDPGRHEELTGGGNARLLGNFRRLLEAGKPVTVRFPLLPGINDGQPNLEALGDLLADAAPGIRLDILPYHRLGNAKYAGLDRQYGLEHLQPPPAERAQEVKEYFAGRGLAARLEL